MKSLRLSAAPTAGAAALVAVAIAYPALWPVARPSGEADRPVHRRDLRCRGGAVAVVLARPRHAASADRACLLRPRPRRDLAPASRDSRCAAARSAHRPRRRRRIRTRRRSARTSRRGVARASGRHRVGARPEAPGRPLAWADPAARTRQLRALVDGPSNGGPVRRGCGRARRSRRPGPPPRRSCASPFSSSA